MRLGSPTESFTRRALPDRSPAAFHEVGGIFKDLVSRWSPSFQSIPGGPAVVLLHGPGESPYMVRVVGRWPSPLDLPGLAFTCAEAPMHVTYEVLPESCDFPLG